MNSLYATCGDGEQTLHFSTKEFQAMPASKIYTDGSYAIATGGTWHEEDSVFKSRQVLRMLERHPDVAQAAVVPIDDEIKGQKPVAFVVRSPGTTLNEQQVKDHVLANAPAYQHPRRVWFLDELPLAGTNKIDRKALVNLATGAS